MKVALIGASGNVGSRILTELLNRGHEVTGIVRHPEKLRRHDRLVAKQIRRPSGASSASPRRFPSSLVNMASAPTRFCRARSKDRESKKFLKVGLRRAASQSKRLRKRRWLPNQLKDWLTRATSPRSPSF